MAYKTVAEGVLVREHPTRQYKGKADRYFTIRYRANGKRVQEKLGWASEGWNVEKAKATLVQLKAAGTTGDGPATLKEKRELAQSKKEAQAKIPTLALIWETYKSTLKKRMYQTYVSNIKLHLAPILQIRIDQLRTHHIDALRAELEGKGCKPQTVKHQLALVRQLIRYGAKHGFCEMPPLHLLHFDMPTVSNQVTESLTMDQIKDFLLALDRYQDKNMALAMQLALATGIRRHAIFCLTWQDVDFERKRICLRAENAKSGRTSYVIMNSTAEKILRTVIPSPSELVFSEKNFQSSRVKRLMAYAKQFLPEGFRQFHGLRHVFASMLASSGTELLTLQKALTQASPEMVLRYAHLTDKAMLQAVSVMDGVFARAANDTTSEMFVPTGQGEPQRAKIRHFSSK